MISRNQNINCAVGVLTFNSAKSLQKCLDSLSRFSQIIVCDGGSNDDTVDIAKRNGCEVIYQHSEFKYKTGKISDFSGVRNQMIKESKHKWFLYLDSDEYLDKKVPQDIFDIIENDTLESPKVFKMLRKYVVEGKIIECSASYPNYHVRFFALDYVEGFRKKVHEKLVLKEGVVPSFINSITYVPIEINNKEIKQKHDYYLRIEYERLGSDDIKILLSGLKSTFRSILVWIVKVFKCRLFCRGRQISFQFDLLNLRYYILLMFLLLELSIKLIFKNNRTSL